MTDDERGPETDPAEETLDSTDLAVLAQLAELLEQVDPVPEDLVERVQFSLALDAMMAEVAQITRVPADALAVRAEPVAGVRTETLTFSAERLTAMVTVTRSAPGRLRMDGWIAPETALRVQLRMREGTWHADANESGRFVFEDLPEGFAQLAFHPVDGPEDATAVVVTPLFQL